MLKLFCARSYGDRVTLAIWALIVLILTVQTLKLSGSQPIGGAAPLNATRKPVKRPDLLA